MEGNAIHRIPMKIHSLGVVTVTDHTKDMIDEPLVSGIPDILHTYLEECKGLSTELQKGDYSLIFSDKFFPDSEQAEFLSEEGEGAWYKHQEREGWLCSCIHHYYERPPKTLYFQVI